MVVEHRFPLSGRLPERIFNRVHEDIGQASMCWVETPKGLFDATRASNVAFELCHFIADELDKYRALARRADDAFRLIQEYTNNMNTPGWEAYEMRKQIKEVLAGE